jgi:chemotaxis protein MotB
MARRRPEETNVNHERWLVSYADFITLLFAFFVVMYSISQVNEGKYRVLSTTFVSAFNNSETQSSEILPIQVGDPSLSVDPSAINLQLVETGKNGNGDFSGDGSFDKTADLPQLSDMFEKEFSDLINSHQVKLHSNEFWLEVALSSSILFDSADAEASLQAESIFSDIADILKPYNNPVQVEGFTDNIPIKTAQFPSNWELSSARAASVVRLLMKGGVEATRLSAVGYGEFQPVADNSTREGRSSNRRVVLMIAREKVDRPNVQTNDEIDRVVNPIEPEVSEPFVQPGLSQADVDLVEPETTTTELVIDAADELFDEVEPEPIDRLSPIGEISPIETRQGGLLFSSDPDLPRN